MAPVLLLLATHVALALNSNRYNSAETSIKQTYDTYGASSSPTEPSHFVNGTISELVPKYEVEVSDGTQTPSTGSTTPEFHTRAAPKTEPITQTMENTEMKFTPSESPNNYIDQSFFGVGPRTERNLINFAKPDQKNKSTQTKNKVSLISTQSTRPLSSHNINNVHGPSRLAPSKLSNAEIKTKNYDSFSGRPSSSDGLSFFINATKNNSSTNNNISSEARHPTPTDRSKFSSTQPPLFRNPSRKSTKSDESLTNRSRSVSSKLMRTLEPNFGGSDATPIEDVRKLLSRVKLSTTNTVSPYGAGETAPKRMRNNSRQQNESIFSELIDSGLRFKSSVIKRASLAPTNQSILHDGNFTNDATEKAHSKNLRLTSSFFISLGQELNDMPLNDIQLQEEPSNSDDLVTTVASSPSNLYTTTKELSESYVNRFSKFLARENRDAFTLSPTLPSHSDIVDQIFQEGLKTKERKDILQPTRESVTEIQEFASDILNTTSVNLNLPNLLNTPVFGAVKRNLTEMNEGLKESPSKIYESCSNCSTRIANISISTVSVYPEKINDETSSFASMKSKIGTLFNVASVTSSSDAINHRGGTVGPAFMITADVSSDLHKTLLLVTPTQESTYDSSDLSEPVAISINSSAVKVIAEFPWPVKKEAVVEGDLVLGGLMMVHEREDTVTCGPVMPQGGIQALEAMLYTLDRLNEASTSLLPNITLGAHILDDCDKDTYGLEMAVDFIKGSISNIDGAEYHCNKTQVRKVISGVVGAASSVTSIQVANLLRLFRIPQVSFFSTSPELSNKQRFEYFTRTIPSDHYQVKAMVDIVRLMGWSYISIIYEESNYGIKAFEELEDLLADYNICIAVKEKLVKDSGVADESAYDNIVQKLLTKPRARGTIIFGSDQEVAGVMRAVKRSNATGSFSWIGSDGWSARSLVSDGNEAEVEGTLSVQPQANPVRGFEEYFLNLNVENNQRNPWFVEFWEDHFQCRYPNSSRTPYNQKYTRLCTGKEKLTRQNTVFENQLQFVSDAVMAFAYAIRDMHKDLCHSRPGLCDAMKPTKGTELLKYLRKVDFEGLSGDRFHFDINGDGPARYNIIHFKQVSAGKYRWIRVGEYLEGELRLNMSEIQFKLGHPKSPESVCSLPCDLGQAKKYVEGESCCWHCFNCTQYQIRHPIDPTQCVGCPLGTVPDSLHVRCIDIPEEYLRPESGWAIGAMGLSSTGILITTFVVCVFIRYNDTPVVRASGRELSYVLLAGILMCYCVTFALVLRPTDIVCGIQRFGAGFCFTVVYAALLTKTNRISRIFNAGKHSAKRPSFISPRSQLIICTGLIAVQVLINGVWMVISPAKAMHHYPTREDNLLVCSTDIDASYMIAFTYPILLIVICTVYAVLTRKIPEAFNESKHIGFTMYTTCVIWLAFVPLYFGTANHVALRITSMSVTISLSASVTVACLFSPKLYIILIRPERNIRQSMMPMRYSAINKSSGTAGSGSMMAPVMVTAATCDPKQLIPKHVPPVQREMSERDDMDITEEKAKPQMIDCSTLTDPPPPAYSESVLNNTEEYIPKINNNCNVGNGPIALLPGIQIKDLPL